MGFTKEYHIFDALYLPEYERYRHRTTEYASALIRKSEKSLRRRLLEIRLRKLFQSDINRYFDYFAKKVNSSDEFTFTGDITPEYAGLSSEVYGIIKNGAESRGFDVKAVFIMRDPVERCISAMKMRRKQMRLDLTDDENASLIKVYSTRDFQYLTRYERTMNNLESVFPAKDIYYNFYENLFNPSTMEEITDLLSVPFVQPNFNKRKNASKTSFQIDESIRKRVFDFYGDTYDFMAGRYGKDYISSIWPNYRNLST